MQSIDAFCHFFPHGIFEKLSATTGGTRDIGKRIQGVRTIYDLEARFRIMDGFENYAQVLSLGLPPLEAMAHGTPVLTSNVSSMPEVFEEAALLVNPESVFEIARGICHILTDAALRETLIRRGHERVRSYSWETAAALVREAYGGVLERRAAA